jgi:two-component system alkaline phosphatase synthesis response regulator PhoP
MSEKKHIMVIDDDVQLVESVETLLTSVGYEVSHAYQAEKGLDLAKETRPDLILLDVMFAGPPGPNGIELARRFRQDKELEGIPVLILSGVRKVLDYPVKLDPDETWMPVKAFLDKPIKPDRLLAEIEAAMSPQS